MAGNPFSLTPPLSQREREERRRTVCRGKRKYGRVGKFMKQAREIRSLMKTDLDHTFHAD
jgi:hypothetical protein